MSRASIFDANASKIQSGWMEKSSAGHKSGGFRASIGNMRAAWERRFFVLNDAHELLYYKDEKEANDPNIKPAGIFNCKGAKFERYPGPAGGFCLVSVDRELTVRVKECGAPVPSSLRPPACHVTATCSVPAALFVSRQGHEGVLTASPPPPSHPAPPPRAPTCSHPPAPPSRVESPIKLSR